MFLASYPLGADGSRPFAVLASYRFVRHTKLQRLVTDVSACSKCLAVAISRSYLFIYDIQCLCGLCGVFLERFPSFRALPRQHSLPYPCRFGFGVFGRIVSANITGRNSCWYSDTLQCAQYSVYLFRFPCIVFLRPSARLERNFLCLRRLRCTPIAHRNTFTLPSDRREFKFKFVRFGLLAALSPRGIGRNRHGTRSWPEQTGSGCVSAAPRSLRSRSRPSLERLNVSGHVGYCLPKCAKQVFGLAEILCASLVAAFKLDRMVSSKLLPNFCIGTQSLVYSFEYTKASLPAQRRSEGEVLARQSQRRCLDAREEVQRVTRICQSETHSARQVT